MTSKKYMLQDVCSFIDYRGKTPPKSSSGIPLITARIVKNGRIQPPQEFIEEELYDSWMRRGIPHKGAILFTTEAPLGEVAQITTNDRLAFAQRIIIIESDERILLPRYLYYALQDDVLRNRIFAKATGTTVVGIKAAELKTVEIDIPDIDTQRKTVELLDAVTNKIDNNLSIINNLTEQQWAYYESWFEQYEPFVAQVTEGESRCIPTGWEEKTLGDVTENIRTRVGKRALKVLSAVNSGKLQPSEEYFTKQVFSKDISKYIVVEENDFSYNPARVNIGSIGMNDLGYPGCVSPVYVVFRTKPVYCNYINLFIKSSRFNEQVKMRASGSVRQALNYSDFSLIPIVIPPQSVVEEFNDIINPIIENIRIRETMNLNLETIKQDLQTALFSGEIDPNNYAFE